MSAYARAERCLMQLLIEARRSGRTTLWNVLGMYREIAEAGHGSDPSTVQRALAAMRGDPTSSSRANGGRRADRGKGRSSAWRRAAPSFAVRPRLGPHHRRRGTSRRPLGTDFQQAVRDAVRLAQESLPAIDAVVPMPNLEHPRRVSAIAELAAGIVGAPVREVLSASPLPGPRANRRCLGCESLSRAFLLGSAPRGVVLLVDESTRTRWASRWPHIC